jgi:hypothetical protein
MYATLYFLYTYYGSRHHLRAARITASHITINIHTLLVYLYQYNNVLRIHNTVRA